jgi:hypothetical protein
MLAAEPDHLARHRHHLEPKHVVRGEAVFEAMHAARVFGDVAADRAGDLRRRIRRVVEARMLHGLGDAEIGDPRLHARTAIGEIDIEHFVELRHAEQNAVFERQGPA